MVDNIDIAYCMAKLEDRIRQEWNSAKITLIIVVMGTLMIRCMEELLLDG